MTVKRGKRIIPPRDMDKCLILPAMMSSCDYTRYATVYFSLLNFNEVSTLKSYLFIHRLVSKKI